MTIEFTNNASGSLSAPIAGVAPGPEDTSLPLQPNEAQLFPDVITSSGDFFYVTIEDTAGNIEICKCTNRDTVTDTLTVERGQENTTSQSFAAGSKVECRPTAGTFDEFLQKLGGTMTGTLDMAGQQLRDPTITNTGTASMRGVPVRGGDNGTVNEFIVPSGGGAPTIGGNIVTHAGNDSAYVKTTRTLINGAGIATIGDLSQDRTIAMDIAPLAQINGNALADGDMFLVLDADVNQHKRILYRNNGVPVITESTTNRVVSNTDLNKYVRFTNAGASTFTLNDNVGVTGNVIIVEQGNTGQVTVNGSAQVNSAFAGLATRTQNSVVVLLCVQGGSTAIWTLYGDAV
jgi:hypothetical protein